LQKSTTASSATLVGHCFPPLIRIFVRINCAMGVILRCLFCLVIGGTVLSGFAQERKSIWEHKLIKRFISSEKDSTRSAGFVVVPALGYAQETGLEFGLAGVYNFYMDKADTTIRTSNVTFIGTFTTQRQTNLKLESDIWTTGNRYHYISELRF